MNEIVTVYALVDIPHITGIDLKEYGYPEGFKAGQIMKIPNMNVEQLIQYGVVSKYPPPHYTCKAKNKDDCPDPRLLNTWGSDTQRLNQFCKSWDCPHFKKVREV